MRTPLIAAACTAAALLALAPAVARTARPASASAARPLTLWAVGDADAGAQARRLAARVRRARPDRFLYLGDVYETGTAREFQRSYDPLWGPLARRTIPTPGNHEWGNRSTGYGPYWRAKLGGRMPAWHRHRLAAGWEILSLNSEAPHGRGSPQLRWLARAVARPGTCRIAIWHRPRWSSGWHGDQADVAPLWAGVSGHARIVISGHDHDLQRFADRDGLRQIVSGAGGRPNLPLSRPSATRRRFVDRLNAGGARLHLTRGRATIELLTATGHMLDRSVVTCRPVRR